MQWPFFGAPELAVKRFGYALQISPVWVKLRLEAGPFLVLWREGTLATGSRYVFIEELGLREAPCFVHNIYRYIYIYIYVYTYAYVYIYICRHTYLSIFLSFFLSFFLIWLFGT